MSIKNWILTGDTHGQNAIRLGNIKRNMDIGLEKETAIIILGDAGFNFYLNKTDLKGKKAIEDYGMYIYCVRGNHEQRPENLGYELIWDKNVQGYVYQDKDCHLIKYFVDGGIYTIAEYRVLVIGGAYSIDKYYRLKQAHGANWSGWFEDEQLTEEEREKILGNVLGQRFNFVLTHTAPVSCEPNDLFLPMVDQSLVDKSTENWLEEVKNSISYDKWCFGHYHGDRWERPDTIQLYYNYYDIHDIYNNNLNYLSKSPKYTEGMA